MLNLTVKSKWLCRDRKGFTLIELLVVISIIALLLSILMPSLSKAKAIAKRVVCGSNLHQLGTVWMLYSDDNRGYYPTNWYTHEGVSYRTSFGNWQIVTENMRDSMEGMLKSGKVFYCPNYKPVWPDSRKGYDDWDEKGTLSSTALKKPVDVYYISYSIYAANLMAETYNVSLGNRLPPPEKNSDRGLSRSPLIIDDTILNRGVYSKSLHYNSSRGEPAGGNALMGDGSVNWRAFNDMMVIFDVPSWPFKRFY